MGEYRELTFVIILTALIESCASLMCYACNECGRFDFNNLPRHGCNNTCGVVELKEIGTSNKIVAAACLYLGTCVDIQENQERFQNNFTLEGCKDCPTDLCNDPTKPIPPPPLRVSNSTSSATRIRSDFTVGKFIVNLFSFLCFKVI